MLDVAKLTRAAVEAVGKERRLAAGRGPAAGKMTSLKAATLGPSGGVVALPCASAKRSRLFPEVFDGCSSVRRGLS